VTLERAALVTGGSSGIGLAIARALGREGYGVTVSGRRADKLEASARGLADEAIEAQGVVANVAAEEEIRALVDAHRQRFGRLDVLVNNAGVGIGGPIERQETSKLDLQLAVNLRAVYVMTRECLPMLREAGAEHGKALLVNMASITGKHGEGGLAAYSASKAGVIGLSQATQEEVADAGVQVVAFCPGFVDTAMSAWTDISKEAMIKPEDIAEGVRFLLRLSPSCFVPEIQFARPGGKL
jgi:NAD(P)-dependent dehydrogenase (short-subunit alcohol dehydrogenase family)